jgi:predicted esterase
MRRRSRAACRRRRVAAFGKTRTSPRQFYNSSTDALKALPPKDLAEFRTWFAEFDLAAWDSQVDADARSGKLDHLLAEAEQDYSAGQPRDL